MSFYDQSPDVALEFFRIMNPKERADTTKSTLQEVKLTADSSVLGEVPEHTTPIAITVPQGPEEQTPAQIVRIAFTCIIMSPLYGHSSPYLYPMIGGVVVASYTSQQYAHLCEKMWSLGMLSAYWSVANYHQFDFQI